MIKTNESSHINDPPFKRGNYSNLYPQFKEVVDYVYYKELSAGILRHSTVYCRAVAASSFLFSIQNKKIDSLSRITEDSVRDYFHPSDDVLLSCTTRFNIRYFLDGAADKYPECSKIAEWVPIIRRNRKNIQYLTDYECTRIKEVCTNEISNLSYMDKSLGLFLLYTGLRACDIATLTLDDIDWDREIISITQQKTEVPLELPVSTLLGNSIYDYLIYERPESNDRHLFLSTKGTNIYSQFIYYRIKRIFKAAGIRQNANDRKGTHIFRHHLATNMLEKSVPQLVISRTLGHTSPSSLEAYLYADIAHLRECALSIECFEISWEEAFDNE